MHWPCVAAARRRPPSGRHQVHDLVLDEDQHRVWRGDTEVHLTATEFTLLRCLLRQRGRGRHPRADPRPRVAVRLRGRDARSSSRSSRRCARRSTPPSPSSSTPCAASATRSGSPDDPAPPARRRRRRPRRGARSSPGVSVVLVQRAFLVDRLDAQLAALAKNPRAILLASARASRPRARPAPRPRPLRRLGRPDERPTAPLTTVLTPAERPRPRPAPSAPASR